MSHKATKNSPQACPWIDHNQLHPAKRLLKKLFIPCILFTLSVYNTNLLAQNFSQADQAEIHIDLCHADENDLFQKLGLNINNRTNREIIYFDYPNLELYNNNLILRVRRASNEQSLTVKIRNLIRDQVDSNWFQIPEFKCEADLYSSSLAYSCSLNSTVEIRKLDKVISKEMSVYQILSNDQVEFIKRFGNTKLSNAEPDLAGPTQSFYLNWSDDQFPKKLTLELWSLGNMRIQEISTRVFTNEVTSMQKRLLDSLQKAGAKICPSDLQRSKTQEALLYYLK